MRTACRWCESHWPGRSTLRYRAPEISCLTGQSTGSEWSRRPRPERQGNLPSSCYRQIRDGLFETRILYPLWSGEPNSLPNGLLLRSIDQNHNHHYSENPCNYPDQTCVVHISPLSENLRTTLVAVIQKEFPGSS